MVFYLLGDVSGTNTRLFISDDNGNIFNLVEYETRKIRDFSKFISKYIKDVGSDFLPERAIFACAGYSDEKNKSINDSVRLTNADVLIDKNDVILKTCLREVELIHDFEAVSRGFNSVCNYEVLSEFRGGKTLVIGAGTGLGVGVLDGENYYNTEGGHRTFRIEEVELERFFYERFGKEEVEWEDILSGRGLERLYEFYSSCRESVERFSKRKDDEYVIETYEEFFYYYGLAARYFAELYDCCDIVIAGGIIAKSWDFFNKKDFLRILGNEFGVKIILDYNVSLYGLIEATKIYFKE